MTCRLTLLAFVLVGAVALAGCRGSASPLPPVHPNQNMDQQNRVDPQEHNPLLPGGTAMQRRVEGTVAWGHLEADDHLYRGRVDGAFANTLPAADGDGAPLTVERSLLERGRDRYAIFCTPCHDATGAGNGIVVQRGMMKPPSFHEERVLAMPLGQLYDVVTNGARNMPPYKAQIGLRDRWAIAAYVRALQISRNAGLELVPPDEAAARRWNTALPTPPKE